MGDFFLLFFFFFSLLSAASSSPCDSGDVQALREFAGNLENGWLVLSSWSNESSSCCSWEGVSCSESSSSSSMEVSRVSELHLPGKGLAGSVSQSLFRLDQLVVLNLSGNSFAGVLLAAISNSGNTGPPICFGSAALQVLDLSMNQFSGEISDVCGERLRELYLDGNSFSGELPASLFSLSNLETLSISANNFSGALSENLGNLSKLSVLVLSENSFSGELPDLFQRLPKLRRLILHSNFFSGGIPPSLTSCSTLEELNLRNNSLSSGAAADFDCTQLPRLSSLDLSGNRFSGNLPAGIPACSSLKILNLAKNSFTGGVPQSYSNLDSLTFLSLSNNSLIDLAGALQVLQRCRNLSALILTRNFHGEELPRNITAGFPSLKILAVGNCGLSGEIPSWISDCNALQVLDLSWNRLQGGIPPWMGELKSLFYLDISNNSLSGKMPLSLTKLKSIVHPDSPSNGATIGVPLYVKRNKSGSAMQYNQISSFPSSLILSYNKLVGPISPEFGKLKGLHVLDLSSNSIDGVIPGEISGMVNLEVLDLSKNRLHGPIPDSLRDLTFLSKFSVAKNNLSGEIPKGGQFFSFSMASFEGNPGLCGEPAPPCHRSSPPPSSPPAVPGRRTPVLAGVVAVCGAVAAACLIAAVLVKIFCKKGERRRAEDEAAREEDPGSCASSKFVLFFHGGEKNKEEQITQITVSDLLRSTNSFSQENIIGCGGFGLVYKADFPDGSSAAVKKLSGDGGQMEREFQAEVETLSRARHKNLVSLKGYCKLARERLLIYPYMEKGSLDEWLHEFPGAGEDGDAAALGWDTRLRIAQGAARGLAYLHCKCQPKIIHRDVKSSNILLNGEFEAHLADFGLARLICPYQTHVTTDLVGTLGYIPPEYGQTLTASFKGDVYSFGVVLLELVTGRRPVDMCGEKSCRDLVSWVRRMKMEGKEEAVFDAKIWRKELESQLRAVLEIACRCVEVDPRSRPSIEEVVSWLDEAAGSD